MPPKKKRLHPYRLVYGMMITRSEDFQRIENPDHKFNMILDEYRPAFEYEGLETFFVKDRLGNVYIGRLVDMYLTARFGTGLISASNTDANKLLKVLCHDLGFVDYVLDYYVYDPVPEPKPPQKADDNPCGESALPGKTEMALKPNPEKATTVVKATPAGKQMSKYVRQIIYNWDNDYTDYGARHSRAEPASDDFRVAVKNSTLEGYSDITVAWCNTRNIRITQPILVAIFSETGKGQAVTFCARVSTFGYIVQGCATREEAVVLAIRRLIDRLDWKPHRQPQRNSDFLHEHFGPVHPDSVEVPPRSDLAPYLHNYLLTNGVTLRAHRLHQGGWVLITEHPLKMDLDANMNKVHHDDPLFGGHFVEDEEYDDTVWLRAWNHKDIQLHQPLAMQLFHRHDEWVVTVWARRDPTDATLSKIDKQVWGTTGYVHQYRHDALHGMMKILARAFALSSDDLKPLERKVLQEHFETRTPNPEQSAMSRASQVAQHVDSEVCLIEDGGWILLREHKRYDLTVAFARNVELVEHDDAGLGAYFHDAGFSKATDKAFLADLRWWNLKEFRVSTAMTVNIHQTTFGTWGAVVFYIDADKHRTAAWRSGGWSYKHDALHGLIQQMANDIESGSIDSSQNGILQRHFEPRPAAQLAPIRQPRMPTRTIGGITVNRTRSGGWIELVDAPSDAMKTALAVNAKRVPHTSIDLGALFTKAGNLVELSWWNLAGVNLKEPCPVVLQNMRGGPNEGTWVALIEDDDATILWDVGQHQTQYDALHGLISVMAKSFSGMTPEQRTFFDRYFKRYDASSAALAET